MLELIDSCSAETTKDKTGLFCCAESGCDRSYSSKQSLTRHLKLDHGYIPPESGRFVCEVCNERYKVAKELIKHYETHGVNIGMTIATALYTACTATSSQYLPNEYSQLIIYRCRIYMYI